MAFSPHRFGRYIIVDPIAVGGMAEIYRARLAAAKEGPDRIIVIKKVIANLSQNAEFLQMFEEEIKITVGLTHPNIIQIYDYGKVDEQYFMAMEYVEGKNLRQFVKRLADMKSMFSIDMSCHIISQVCHALAHAHSYKDRLTGKPLGIVHRDISPQNVMISYDGAVKLFDFGIAKAKSASEATRAGVIKGKPSYLSPEQINGEDLDGRSDIFALGIVLWELLTAKRLFVAETDMGVLRLIQSAKIEPPSTFNPAVPQALDAIVLKSLTRDKNKRYQGAEEFQRDLHKFLYSFNPSFNPADLSYYAQELFKGEIREDRERLSKYLSMEPVDAGDGEGAAEKKKPALSTKLADGLMSTTDFNREVLDQVHSTDASQAPSAALQLATSGQMSQPRSMPPLPGGKPALPGSTAGSISGLRAGSVPAAKRGDNMVIPPWSKQAAGSGGLGRPGTRSTASLRKELDDQHSSGGRNIAVLMAVFLVGVIVAARQYGYLKGTPLDFLHPESEVADGVGEPSGGEQRSPAGEAAPAPRKAHSVNVQKGHGVVILQTDATNYRVLVNGQPVAVRNNQFSAPLDEPLNIDVIRFGYQTARFQTRLTAGGPAAFRVDFRALPSGTVQISTIPETKLTFFSEGEKVLEARTPFKQEGVPVGRYRVRMENALLNLQTEIEILVEEGRLTRVEKTLR